MPTHVKAAQTNKIVSHHFIFTHSYQHSAFLSEHYQNIMEPEQLLAAGMIVQVLGVLYVRRRRRRLDREQDQQAQRPRRRVWVHEMNQTRRESSVFNRFNQLKQFPDRFHSQFRMTPQTFTYLIQVGATDIFVTSLIIQYNNKA